MAEITEHNHSHSFQPAMVEETAGRCWYAIHTSPRHERKVERFLHEKSVATFLPLVSTLRQWSDRRRLVSAPLFPGYLFVSITPTRSTRLSVIKTRGVLGFVGSAGVGTALPDQQIEVLRNVIDSGVYCCPHPFLAIGRRVRIVGGSLDGTEGVLLAKNGDDSVVVSVDLIQRSLAIRVTGYRLEPI